MRPGWKLGITISAFFFSSRRRHTRFDCDWSSDVCSSDLGDDVRLSRGAGAREGAARLRQARRAGGRVRRQSLLRPAKARRVRPRADDRPRADRKSVGWGKSVDLGGRRIIKKKKNKAIVGR